MSFVDQRLPSKYALQAVASDDWMIEVVESLGRGEYRNSPGAHPRRAWDLSVNAKTSDERAALHAWFLAMRGPLHSFALRDPADYSSIRGNIGTGNGTAVAFQLIKNYTIGSMTYSRPITKPVVATVRIWVNNVEAVSGWSVSRTTGIVTFTAPPANGHAVEASCEFDVPVRFAESRLAWTRVDRNVSRGDLWMCDQLSLIEVLGE